jgi:hypothetical protein
LASGETCRASWLRRLQTEKGCRRGVPWAWPPHLYAGPARNQTSGRRHVNVRTWP